MTQTLGLSADSHKVDLYEVQDNIKDEQETLPDNKGPLQILDVLNTVGEVSRAVKDKTDAKYQW